MAYTRAAETLDVYTVVDVSLSSRPSPVATTGIAVLGVGMVGVLAGAVAFLSSYPERWYVDRSNTLVELTILLLGAGLLLTLLGTSLMAYGRTVVGEGATEAFEANPPVEPAVPVAYEDEVSFQERPATPPLASPPAWGWQEEPQEVVFQERPTERPLEASPAWQEEAWQEEEWPETEEEVPARA